MAQTTKAQLKKDFKDLIKILKAKKATADQSLIGRAELDEIILEAILDFREELADLNTNLTDLVEVVREIKDVLQPK